MQAASETDFHPSRMVVVAKCVEAFIREFFDQNPLSHIGMVTIKDGVAQRLTELGGSPDSQIKSLFGKLECSGDASLQNALELVHGYLSQIPSYGHREVLILYSALNTCDPGDVMETVQQCKKAKIRCSVIGLSAEIYICKHLCEETGGSYTVALDEVRIMFLSYLLLVNHVYQQNISVILSVSFQGIVTGACPATPCNSRICNCQFDQDGFPSERSGRCYFYLFLSQRSKGWWRLHLP